MKWRCPRGTVLVLLVFGLEACGGGEGGEGDGDTDTDTDTDTGTGTGTGTDTSSAPTCDELDPPWDPAWIGGPCGHDLDCAFDEGICLPEEEGFPCGTCSQPCELYCPDIEGAPVTFCVDAGHLGLDPGEGLCVSRCDPERFGGDGCREGYACAVLPRFGEEPTTTGVCVPEDLAPEPTDCLERLDALGLDWEPTDVEPRHPEGRPDLTCEIEDPVYLYGPVDGVGFRYLVGGDEGPILVACELALAIARMADALTERGAVDFQHMGTYNCRVIAGSDQISTHGYALAIDLQGFLLDDGTQLTVFDDWEDGVADPVTFGGRWLKDFAQSLYDDWIFNIVLTPEYNAAHDDHFHVDMTPGSHFLGFVPPVGEVPVDF